VRDKHVRLLATPPRAAGAGAGAATGTALWLPRRRLLSSSYRGGDPAYGADPPRTLSGSREEALELAAGWPRLESFVVPRWNSSAADGAASASFVYQDVSPRWRNDTGERVEVRCWPLCVAMWHLLDVLAQSTPDVLLLRM
jgi:hypothetical protein